MTSQGLANEYAIDAMIFSPNWEGAEDWPSRHSEVYTRYYKTTPDLDLHRYQYH